MMRTRNLRHVNSFKNSYMFFLDGGVYGRSYTSLQDHDATLASFGPAIRAGVCVPRSTGELILTRQHYMCQLLNIMIEDILDVGSISRSKQERAKRLTQSASTVHSTLAIVQSAKPGKIELPLLISNSSDRKSFLDEYLSLVCNEPVVLAHDVNVWFFSRPELVADERGRILPAHTDRYISSAFVEAVHKAVNSAAIWHYICRLLELLRGASHKAHRATLLQEISNMCQLEYNRAQSMLKRHISTGIGSKWFRRISNSSNNRLVMKGDPDLLTRENPQLQCLLRLCQPETNASQAMHWIQKLDDLYKSHPSERETLQEREADSLCDLAITVGFIQSLSLSVAIPPFNKKKGQFFASRAAELGAELDQIKTEIDLTDFAAPIENLLEPDMAKNSLNALDQCIINNMGTKMGFIYEDLITDCTLRLTERAINDQADQQAKNCFISLPSDTSAQPREVRIQERRRKDKTRPDHSSIYEINPSVERPVKGMQATEPMEPLIVKTATAATFFTLFSKSEARGSITWAAFEAAMADLGFSIIPEYGSVYAFTPPPSLALRKSIKLHRPHRSRIEGYQLLFLASRLNRNYGWTSQSFQVA
ncbi:hypothetical protein F5Y13DRAFT_165453 [Hypoxylon sp. FL1857]|nr:hypothetical protein F5Y13DRAFT_165453 [Hypoxylon sp. FL1857]